jgi:CheY-like chemotaxis protein
MSETHILWADDEIELLKPHILFLQGKGYKVTQVNNGTDAVEEVKKQPFDVVFLDENMPGLSGLETLERVKASRPDTPVIMITKSEEERIMEEAIGAKIADYLIKPVNPNQILLSLKKILEKKKLVDERTTVAYQQEFRQISMQLSDRLDWEEWKELYAKLSYWDIELGSTDDPSMKEILASQRQEANAMWSRYIENNYLHWLSPEGSNKAPVMSHTVLKEWMMPLLGEKPVLLVVIDNLRFDQWRVIKPMLSPYFNVEKEELFMSILPSATQYARNALFAGMMPSEIQKRFPNQWVDEDQEGSKNQFEDVFLEANLKRMGKQVRFSYNKITNLNAGKKLADNFSNLLQNQLNVVVYNFVDMLSHARTDMEVIRELADNEQSYRSITQSWFSHSPLFDIIRSAAEAGITTVITTDHGTVHVKEPSKIIGDRNTNTNLRYKFGKNLSYEKRDVFEVKQPEKAFLPRNHMSTVYVFAKEYGYFVYPNNYNHFVNFYRGTFQHGGISMEEMIIPFVVLKPKA